MNEENKGKGVEKTITRGVPEDVPLDQVDAWIAANPGRVTVEKIAPDIDLSQAIPSQVAPIIKPVVVIAAPPPKVNSEIVEDLELTGEGMMVGMLDSHTTPAKYNICNSMFKHVAA